MVFTAEPSIEDIATYTHGMIQAIYKAYGLGPSCTPYEIAVGDQTKKMASCPCTVFMVATGYPPTSIHFGRGESWAPLYEPYNPDGRAEPNEVGVIRDLNNAWSDACTQFLGAGLQILDDDHIAEDHRASRDAARHYLTSNKGKTVAATLVLDAVSLHEAETERINRTLGSLCYSGLRHFQGTRNPLVDAARLVEALEAWFPEYTKRHTRGQLAPQAAVGAIEGGWPFKPEFIPGVCHIYIDLRTNAHQTMLSVKREFDEFMYGFRRAHPETDVDWEMTLSVPGSRTDPRSWIIQSCLRAWERWKVVRTPSCARRAAPPTATCCATRASPPRASACPGS